MHNEAQMKLVELLVWDCGRPSPNLYHKLFSISAFERQLACQPFDTIKLWNLDAVDYNSYNIWNEG